MMSRLTRNSLDRFMSIAEAMGRALEKTSISTNIKVSSSAELRMISLILTVFFRRNVSITVVLCLPRMVT